MGTCPFPHHSTVFNFYCYGTAHLFLKITALRAWGDSSNYLHGIWCFIFCTKLIVCTILCWYLRNKFYLTILNLSLKNPYRQYICILLSLLCAYQCSFVAQNCTFSKFTTLQWPPNWIIFIRRVVWFENKCLKYLFWLLFFRLLFIELARIISLWAVLANIQYKG